jgi:hypothetical protein
VGIHKWLSRLITNTIKVENSNINSSIKGKITKINYLFPVEPKIQMRRCPQCASKKKKAGFYISYLTRISSLMIESGL